MLGRKDYTKEEFEQAKSAVDAQLAVYRKLAKAAAADKRAAAAMQAFGTPFFNNMVLVLDRFFVHRVRLVTGKDGNPLNEVELVADSLMNNDGVLKESNVIKLVPEQSVLKLKPGDPIRLSAGDFERLAAAFFEDLERKFLR